MKGKGRTTYEAFEASSAKNRRLLRQEELILGVTEAVCEILEREGLTQAELARRLGKTKGFVSQVLAGDRNLTLRTIADIADALELRAELQLVARPRRAARPKAIRRAG